MYDTGEGVEQNMKMAADLYQQAHEAGNEVATYNLGTMYETGEGVKQDSKKAIIQTSKRRRAIQATQASILGWRTP